MAQREGSIYLGLFVASFILFAAAVVVIFVLQNQVDEVRAELDQQTQAYQDSQDRLGTIVAERKALRELIGGTGAGDNWPGDESYAAELQQLQSEYNTILEAESGDLESVNFSGLTDPYDHLLTLARALQSQKNAAVADANAARANFETQKESHEQTLASLDETKNRLSEEVAQLQTTIETLEQSNRERISQLTAEKEELNDEIEQVKRQMTRQVAVLNSEIETYKLRLDVLNEQQRQQPTIDDIESDGEILEVESRTQIAWINLGQKDNLRAGLVFRIFQDVGGKRVWKGTLEVRRVEPEFSQVKILSQESRLNPVAVGDQIASVFYDPESQPSFVFAGDTSKIDLPSIRQKLESLGARVLPEVDVYTDYLVALENYEGTTAFETAKDLGVTIMREEDLRTYLGR